MNHVTPGRDDPQRRRRRLVAAVKAALGDARSQLSLLNRQVGGNLNLRDVDMDCLDLINRHGPLSPSALARRAGLRPTTMTGILNRLEQGGWLSRERDPADRRGVVIRALRQRNAELFRLLVGMNTFMDEICAEHTDAELELLAGFLGRTANAGREASNELAVD